jgi:hypothetical protein
LLERTLTYAAHVVVIAAVALPLHYLTSLDWPWAILVGGAMLIALRGLMQREATARLRRGRHRPT